MTTLNAALLWCAFQTTAVAAAAVVTYLVTSRGGATARAGVALAGLAVAALLAPLAFAPWPRWELSSRTVVASGDAAAVPVGNSEPAGPPVSVANQTPPWSAAWNGFLEGLREPSVASEPPRSTPPSPTRDFDWPRLLAWAFGAAALAGLVRLALGAWSVHRTIRRAQPIDDPALSGLVDVLKAALCCKTTVELRESADVATAATAGWRTPVLLLPPDWRTWTEGSRRAVVAHELAHVKRRDFLCALGAQTALAVHFYHPLLHWLAGRLRLEQELAADALAASVSGGRAEYLRTLAELALRRSDGRVAWPARAFLPSRHTFLRRIEMLRDPRRAVDRPAPFLRTTAAVLLMLVGVAVAGLRPSLADAQNAPAATIADGAAAAETQSDAAASPPAAVRSPLAYVPAHAQFVVTIGVEALLKEPTIQPFVGELEKGIAESRDPAWNAMREAGVSLRTIRSLHLGVLPGSRGGADPSAFVLRLTKPIDRAALEKGSSATKAAIGGTTYSLGDMFASVADDTTLLLAKDEETLTAMSIGGQINLAASPWTRIAPRLGEPALAVLVDTKSAATQVRTMLTGAGGEPQAQKALIVLAPVMPLLEDTKLAGLAFSLGEKQGLRGYALADDASAAERVAETLRAVVTLGQNTLRQLRSRASTRPPQEQALLATFLPIAERLLESAQVRTEGTDVTLVAEAGDSAAIALGLILPAVQNAREAARRQQSMNNLKQIALAFHNYHADHGHFPPAVIDSPTVVGGKSFPRSWRVELLPYLEQDALYREYRKDEPWDSELNKRLLERMPAVYKDPSDATERTNTSYFVLTGPETMFSGTGKAMSDVKDGTSNTILAVEARRNVPWMKPEDIPFDPSQSADLLQKQVGGNHEAGFIVALVDGSVRFVSKAIDAGVWNGLVTPDGGEIVDPGSDPRPASAVSAP